MVEILKYALAGLVNTMVGYAVFFLAFRCLMLSAALANTVGYAVALLVAFQLNKFFVFSSSVPNKGAVWRFAAAFLAAFVLNQFVLFGLVSFGVLRVELAQVVAMGTYSVSFYLGTKYFVFQRKA